MSRKQNRASTSNAASTQMVGRKRRLSLGNESGEKKSKKHKTEINLPQVYKKLHKSLPSEDLQNIQKSDDKITFSANGLIGVTISIEINKERVQLRTLFFIHRENVQIEFVPSSSDSLIAMLLCFLTHAKKVNKKEDFFECNWDDIPQSKSEPRSAIHSTDVPKSAPSPMPAIPEKEQDQSYTANTPFEYSLPSSVYDSIVNQTESSESTAMDELTKLSDNKPSGDCVKCGQRAYLNCERCRDYYCSTECQKSDWSQHKKHCIAMPKLVEPE